MEDKEIWIVLCNWDPLQHNLMLSMLVKTAIKIRLASFVRE